MSWKKKGKKGKRRSKRRRKKKERKEKGRNREKENNSNNKTIMNMYKNLKGDKNHSLNEVCENTKHKQWDEIMNIAQDTKVEAESMKTSQTEIKLIIKI